VRRRSALVLVALVLAACTADGVLSRFDDVSMTNPRELPVSLGSREGRPGPAGGTVFDPLSDAIEEAVPYRFSLGHCGLHSPIDVDGSFWDPVDGVTATGAELDLAGDGEMINSTQGIIVVIGDEARFRTGSGSVVRFARHAGETEFPGCD
jgi:hypothetical protein